MKADYEQNGAQGFMGYGGQGSIDDDSHHIDGMIGDDQTNIEETMKHLKYLWERNF